MTNIQSEHTNIPPGTARPEHIALNVPDPVASIQWYTENLSMKVVRKGTPPAYTSFIADSGQHMMLEVFHDVNHPMLDFPGTHHMSVHLAFMVDAISATKERFIAAGAKLVEDVTRTAAGDHVMMLRDPWGVPIQCVERTQPMLQFTVLRPEHLAFNVPDSRATAQWLVQNLGMRVIREGGAPTHGIFLSDPQKNMLIELYRNTDYPMLDFGKMSHMSIHLAFMVHEIAATKEHLLLAGATLQEDMTKTPAGDLVLMLRAPWGLPVQLVQRTVPMVK